MFENPKYQHKIHRLQSLVMEAKSISDYLELHAQAEGDICAIADFAVTSTLLRTVDGVTDGIDQMVCEIQQKRDSADNQAPENTASTVVQKSTLEVKA